MVKILYRCAHPISSQRWSPVIATPTPGQTMSMDELTCFLVHHELLCTVVIHSIHLELHTKPLAEHRISTKEEGEFLSSLTAAHYNPWQSVAYTGHILSGYGALQKECTRTT